MCQRTRIRLLAFVGPWSKRQGTGAVYDLTRKSEARQGMVYPQVSEILQIRGREEHGAKGEKVCESSINRTTKPDALPGCRQGAQGGGPRPGHGGAEDQGRRTPGIGGLSSPHAGNISVGSNALDSSGAWRGMKPSCAGKLSGATAAGTISSPIQNLPPSPTTKRGVPLQAHPSEKYEMRTLALLIRIQS